MPLPKVTVSTDIGQTQMAMLKELNILTPITRKSTSVFSNTIFENNIKLEIIHQLRKHFVYRHVYIRHFFYVILEQVILSSK